MNWNMPHRVPTGGRYTPRNQQQSRTFRGVTAPRPASRYGVKTGPSPWKVALAVTGALLAFFLAGSFIVANAQERRSGSQVSLGVQLDQNTVGYGTDLVDTVTDIAQRHAAAGGGTLTAYKGSGQKPIEVGRADLAVIREGNLETDAGLREKVTRQTVDEVLNQVKDTTVAGEGRDVLALLHAIAQNKPSEGQLWDVVIYSLGLSTVDPSDVRVLMAADPAQAVESLPASSIPDLKGARVQWIFPATTGQQEPLNTRTTLWRKAFLTKLMERSNALLYQTVERNVPGTSEPGTPNAPTVSNLQDPTPAPSSPPQPDQPLIAALDAGALFAADSTTLLDREAAAAGVSQLVEAWKTDRYSAVECVGRVAAFGSPEVGMVLSGKRAEIITGLLAEMGVPAVARGAGSAEPLPGDPKGAHQRSVICTAQPR